jgi:pyruvate formate-lyase activating enzyme-like uncharacterized protein
MEVRELDLGCAVRGRLPKGCVHCHRGGKLVLFITGKCGYRCFYCPLSEHKFGHDVIYANERPVRSAREMIEEARTMDATGTGITGGDPIARLDRTCDWINALKSEFGARHHVHLYTATPISLSIVERLEASGLDELRIHVPAASWEKPERYVKCLRDASTSSMDLGVEVPVVPDKGRELQRLLGSLEGSGIDFVNLNELELSDTTVSKMGGYEPDGDGYAVKGSCAVGRRLVRLVDRGYTVHFCSVQYKDAGQLRRRLMRRGRKVRKAFQELTKDGTLLFAVVEGNKHDLSAEFSRLRIPISLYSWNERKDRMELAPWVAEAVASKFKPRFKVYLIEEYPTWDALEVERTPLGR